MQKIISLTSIALLCMTYYVSNFIYFNPSKSQPPGYYFVYKLSRYKTGDVVLVCVSDKRHVEIMHKLGLPNKKDGKCPQPYLLKKIVAESGDVINIKPKGVEINNVLYPNTEAKDEYRNIKLRPLKIGTKYHLAKGEYFLLGQTATSYDSRYFGVVDAKEINFKAILLLARNKLL